MHISFWEKVCQLVFYKYNRQDSFEFGYNEFLQLDAGLSAVKIRYVFCYRETSYNTTTLYSKPECLNVLALFEFNDSYSGQCKTQTADKG